MTTQNRQKSNAKKNKTKNKQTHINVYFWSAQFYIKLKLFLAYGIHQKYGNRFFKTKLQGE